MSRCTSSGLSTTGKRSRCFGYGRSSRTSRRFSTYRQKNRSAQICVTTVPIAEPSLLEEEQVVASELGGSDPIEARTRVLAKCLNDLDVAADGGSGVVATHQLVAQALQ